MKFNSLQYIPIDSYWNFWKFQFSTMFTSCYRIPIRNEKYKRVAVAILLVFFVEHFSISRFMPHFKINFYQKQSFFFIYFINFLQHNRTIAAILVIFAKRFSDVSSIRRTSNLIFISNIFYFLRDIHFRFRFFMTSLVYFFIRSII